MTNSSLTLPKMRRFDGFERRVPSSSSRRSWFLLNRSRSEKRKQPKVQRSMLEACKRESDSTIDLEHDEMQSLKIHALSKMAGFAGIEGESLPCFQSKDVREEFAAAATDTITSESEDSSSTSYDCADSSVKSVSFADDRGMPMEQVFQIESVEQDASVVVLCLSPRQRKFEFVHCAYYRQDSRGVDGSDGKATLLSDLLLHLPRLCTDELFQNAEFPHLYLKSRESETLMKLTGNSNKTNTDLLLDDCIQQASDIVVACVDKVSDGDLQRSADSILDNALLMKAMRRAKRSQRGLKWIPKAHASFSVSRTSAVARMIKQRAEAVLDTVFDYVGLFLGDDDDDDEEEVLQEYDCFKTTTKEEQEAQYRLEHLEQEVIQGLVMVTSLTFVFSLLGM